MWFGLVLCLTATKLRFSHEVFGWLWGGDYTQRAAPASQSLIRQDRLPPSLQTVTGDPVSHHILWCTVQFKLVIPFLRHSKMVGRWLEVVGVERSRNFRFHHSHQCFHPDHLEGKFFTTMFHVGLLSMNSGCAWQPLQCLLLRLWRAGWWGQIVVGRVIVFIQATAKSTSIKVTIIRITKMSGDDCPDRGEEDEAAEDRAGGEGQGERSFSILYHHKFSISIVIQFFLTGTPLKS